MEVSSLLIRLFLIVCLLHGAISAGRAKAAEADTASTTAQHPGEKSAGAAFMFSVFLPGGGQFYNGEGLKGLAMLVGFFGALAIGSHQNDPSEEDLGVAVGIGIWALSLVDAPLSARRINRARRAEATTTASHVDVAAGRPLLIGFQLRF